jgi:hypothetical protein
MGLFAATAVRLLDKDTFAHDFVRGGNTSGSGKQSAEAWFENSDADRYETGKSAFPIGLCRCWCYCTHRMKCWTPPRDLADGGAEPHLRG